MGVSETIISTIIAAFVLAEMNHIIPWLCEFILKKAVKRLPENVQADCREEWWEGYLSRPGMLARLFFAIDLYWKAVPQIVEICELQNPRPMAEMPSERISFSAEDTVFLAKLLKAAANEKRLIIIQQLYFGEKSITDLEETIGLPSSALSQHLARLRREGVVSTRRENQTIFYSIKDESSKLFLKGLFDVAKNKTTEDSL